MIPLFFGQSAQPLYGVYHAPATQPRAEGVLLCCPFGQEYMRSHRAMRQLAMLLSKKGFHVFRFDYFGTGDSAGEMDHASVEHWLDDIALAAEELRETAGIQRVSLVGLRLGAMLAVMASEKLEVDRLAVWDPINSGLDYEAELRKKMAEDKPVASNEFDDKGNIHFNGFTLSRAIRDELQAIRLVEKQPKARRILHVVSGENDGSRELKAAWGGLNGYEYELAPSPSNWNYVDEFGGILLPQPVIQAIVGWMSQ